MSAECWQYQMRVDNREEDLKRAGFTEEYVSKLTVKDFDFGLLESDEHKREAKAFILRHEWLGTLSQYTTHWFGAYHNDQLAGVQLFNLPNTFSKSLGEDTPQLERLVSRGACISWSPKNLASAFLMWCIDWMVKNTPYRLFTAYSDPMANELGTIYQACNFYYLGQTFGASKRFINPYTGKEVSDRFFRQKTAYRKFANELGIPWQKEWSGKTGMIWENVPDGVEEQLREHSREKQRNATKVATTPKHKYAYVKGGDKRETARLRAIFEKNNKIRAYPKERGK